MNANEPASERQALLAFDPQPTESAMSWPILPIALRVKKQGWPAVWLPVVLFWPLIIAVLCLALPLCAALLPGPRRNVVAALLATYQTMCALHGAQVEVTGSEHDTWSISLY